MNAVVRQLHLYTASRSDSMHEQSIDNQELKVNIYSGLAMNKVRAHFASNIKFTKVKYSRNIPIESLSIRGIASHSASSSFPLPVVA